MSTRIIIFNKTTNEEVTPDTSYNYSSDGYFVGADGKVYQFDDDGGCSDPECCGSAYYYMTHAKDYDWKVEIE